MGEIMKNTNKNKVMLNLIKILSVAFFLYIQIKFVIIQMDQSSNFLKYFNCMILVLQLSFIVYIIFKFQNPSYKTIWIIQLLYRFDFFRLHLNIFDKNYLSNF